MIQPLRRAHWRLMLTLALTLPILLLLSLLQRRPSIYDSAPPETLIGQTRDWSPIGTWTPLQGSVTGHVRTVTAGSQRGLDVDLSQPHSHPDVLAYWSDGEPHSLPADAWLLGEITSRNTPAMPLPEVPSADRGRLILYSLGHGEVIGWADVELP